VAQASGNGSVYTFASSVTLNANTQYYFYANAPQTVASSAASRYAGGDLYQAGNNSTYTASSTSDTAFLLQGTAVAAAVGPEPGTLPLLGMGLVTGAGMVGGLSRSRETIRRRKAFRACVKEQAA